MKTYSNINDPQCGWSRISMPTPLREPGAVPDSADWVIIGAGFTGISAAYRLAALRPQDSIVLLDAEKAGHGASARNSGFIVDVTLNDGATSLADEQAQLAKTRLNRKGMSILKQRVEKFGIDCDWDEAGKFHCAADPRHVPKLHRFAQFLQRHELPFQQLERDALSQRLGTEYYLQAVHTAGSVLVNPAALVNGLLLHLPDNVQLCEHTAVLDYRSGPPISLQTSRGEIRAGKVIVAVNALMPRLGLKTSRVFPLVLTASLTRPLSEDEYSAIGRPAPWGVLSASSMGATVRLTRDRRIMVRNTVEWRPELTMPDATLQQRRKRHLQGLRRRFPTLDRLEFEHSWSGTVCISRNSKPVFEKAQDNLYLAGCYNAGGIAMGTLFGELIADYACDRQSETLAQVLQQEKPTRLPPRPLFTLGLKTRLAFNRFQGRKEA